MISAPDDYGLTAEQTLAHRGDGLRPDGFDGFWDAVREAVVAMPRRFLGTLDSPVAEVLIRSLNDVNVVGWVHRPEGRPRGLVATTHGYTVGGPDRQEQDVAEWTERGLAVLRLRVRGFAPSTAELGELGAEWILHRIESATDWVLRGAVADLMCACRCLRSHMPGLPLVLHGDSFGGGLGVVAAAQLGALDEAPDRLVVSLPSLGDWTWRIGRYCNGSGGLVNMLLDALRDDRIAVVRSLGMFDAATHAADVSCPALAKVALRDDTVPAPSAAAVVNGLASSPKWRFVTKYGHFDGGIADFRRHVLFRQLLPDFLDPALDLRDFDRRHRGQLDL